jgi:hypothetical protein
MLQLLNVLAFVATVIVNFLSQSANTLGLGSVFPNTVAQLGESRAIFFLPAGYVFSIWGLIYLGLGAFTIWQAAPARRRHAVLERIGPWFIVSSVANIAWLILFLNDQVGLSMVAMLVLLVSLLVIYVRLDIGRAAVSTAVRLAVHIPFSIYLGWITVATVANIAAALYVEGNVASFVGIGADVWAVIMIAVATLLAVPMVFLRKDYAYALVPVWAFIGIFARPFDTPVYNVVSGLNAGIVDAAAIIGAVIIVLVIAYHAIQGRALSAHTAPHPA